MAAVLVVVAGAAVPIGRRQLGTGAAAIPGKDNERASEAEVTWTACTGPVACDSACKAI